MTKLNKAEAAAKRALALAIADKALLDSRAAVWNDADSRDVLIANIIAAVGVKPSDERISLIRRTYTINRMARMLPSNRTPDERVLDVTILLDKYAGATAKDVPEGKQGRRTAEQDAAYVAARNWTGKLIADAGLSDTCLTSVEKAVKAKKAAEAKAAEAAAKAVATAKPEAAAKPEADAKVEADATREPNRAETTPPPVNDKGAALNEAGKVAKWTDERFGSHFAAMASTGLLVLNRAIADTKNGLDPKKTTAVEQAMKILKDAFTA